MFQNPKDFNAHADGISTRGRPTRPFFLKAGGYRGFAVWFLRVIERDSPSPTYLIKSEPKVPFASTYLPNKICAKSALLAQSAKYMFAQSTKGTSMPYLAPGQKIYNQAVYVREDVFEWFQNHWDQDRLIPPTYFALASALARSQIPCPALMPYMGLDAWPDPYAPQMSMDFMRMMGGPQFIETSQPSTINRHGRLIELPNPDFPFQHRQAGQAKPSSQTAPRAHTARSAQGAPRVYVTNRMIRPFGHSESPAREVGYMTRIPGSPKTARPLPLTKQRCVACGDEYTGTRFAYNAPLMCSPVCGLAARHFLADWWEREHAHEDRVSKVHKRHNPLSDYAYDNPDLRNPFSDWPFVPSRNGTKGLPKVRMADIRPDNHQRPLHFLSGRLAEDWGLFYAGLMPIDPACLAKSIKKHLFTQRNPHA